MAEQQTQKRVLLPAYYSGRAQFTIGGGVPSGAYGAQAKVPLSLEPYPHWLLALRVGNVERTEGADWTLTEAANLATSDISEMQEIRCTIGTYEIFDWTLQKLIVGKPGVWAPFPVKFSAAGNVQVIVEARRLTGYPYNLIPDFAVSLATTPLRVDRPGAVFDLDVS